jgi:hypothetical protein
MLLSSRLERKARRCGAARIRRQTFSVPGSGDLHVGTTLVQQRVDSPAHGPEDYRLLYLDDVAARGWENP